MGRDSIGRDSAWPERIAEQTARISRQIHDSGLRVFALAAAVAPGEAVFGNLEETDGEITAIQVEYPVPDGRWVEVDSSRGHLAPLRLFLEHRLQFLRERSFPGLDRLFPDPEFPSPDRSFPDPERSFSGAGPRGAAGLAWVQEAATLLVDGRAVPAETVRAGDRWQVWRCAVDGVRITVLSHGWTADPVAVTTLPDPAPMLDRLATVSPVAAGGHNRRPIPPGEPHRVLIETILCRDIEHPKWSAESGRMPDSSVVSGELWEAAVRRQRELSDDPDAAGAVGDMVHLVVTLQHEADWFRNDADLRRRAIAEILLRVTGLGPDVPSAPAQEAWRHRADGRDWRAAWRDWATGRP